MAYLTPLNALKVEDLENDIIISYNLRKSFIFKDVKKLYNFIINSNNPCYYEVLSENKIRKMYFDIDIKDKNLVDIDDLIKNIYDCLSLLLNDPVIMITKSENNYLKKCGIHVIILNYYVKNVYSAKRFYYNFIEKLDEKYKEFFDDQVYKSCQQFRLLFSSKNEEVRPKLFYKIVPKQNISVNKYILFVLSLLSYCKEGFSEIKLNEIIVNDYIPMSNKYIEINDIDHNFSKIILEKAQKYIDLSCFNMHGIKGIFLILKRIRPSMCKNCNRVHESENAFLYHKNNRIFFGCRRNNKNIDIGELFSDEELLDKNNEKYILLQKNLTNYFS